MVKVDGLLLEGLAIKLGENPCGAVVDSIDVLDNLSIYGIHVNKFNTIAIQEYPDRMMEMRGHRLDIFAKETTQSVADRIAGGHTEKAWLVLQHPQGLSWFRWSRLQSHRVEDGSAITLTFPESEVTVSGDGLEQLARRLDGEELQDFPSVWACASYARKWDQEYLRKQRAQAKDR